MKKTTTIVGALLMLIGCNNSTPPTQTTSSNNQITVIDGVTYENIPFTKEYNWDDANRYCQDKGWRLPSRVELAKIANIPLYKIDANNEKWFKDYDKWFSKNKSRQNSNLFVKKIFVKNMTKGDSFWTSEKDTSMPKESNYHYTILFYKGYIGTNEGHLTNSVLCVK